MNINSRVKIKLFCLQVVLTAGMAETAAQKPSGNIFVQQPERNIRQWEIVWQDDFSSGMLDTTKWSKVPPNRADWGKHMTDDPKCYKLKNGKLFLLGVVNTDTAHDARKYLTGGVYTKGKFAFQYGKIEIRAKLEGAKGAWPAMWLLAAQKKYGSYPRNGEIDIMEHLNFEKKVYQTTHSYYTLELKQDKNPPHFGTANIRKNKFNTYGLMWYSDKLVFTVNGKVTFTYPKVENVDASQWPYDQPFYLLIDQQLGGSWVGNIQADDLPVQMIVDWVKVYQ